MLSVFTWTGSEVGSHPVPIVISFLHQGCVLHSGFTVHVERSPTPTPWPTTLITHIPQDRVIPVVLLVSIRRRQAYKIVGDAKKYL